MIIPIETVLQAVLKDAEKRQSDAGYSGSMSDGGSGKLYDQVRFYRLGMANELPVEWNKYKEAIQLEGMICPVCTIRGDTQSMKLTDVDQQCYGCKKGHIIKT